MRPRSILLALAATMLAATVLAATAGAQTTTQTGIGGGGSPHVKSDWTIGGSAISIAYGRPSLKGRDEAKMMPVGAPWRTGADEATVITTSKDIMFGSHHLPAGTYTINTQPGDKDWQLIIGKLGTPKQWGVPYLPNLELFRIPMTLGKAAKPVEMVTYSIDPAPNGGTLRIEWGTVKVTAPFMVM
ncbi:MAG: hypothetical protein JWM95_3934 [Gemmatimonadetes bacterium]|nr:hypothetical protein [Gemmatimonadota bacterium]